MAGVRLDEVDKYRKDMYKFQRDGVNEEEVQYSNIYKVVTGAYGAGCKRTQQLSAGPLTRHETDGQNIDFKSPVQGWTSYVKYWTYSDGLNFTPEAVEDSIKVANTVKDLANTWGVEIRVAKETMASRVFNEGGDLTGDWVFDGSYTGETDPSGDLPYDSEPFFNLTGNTRSTKGTGTYYNSVFTAYPNPATGSILPSHIRTLYVLMTSTNNRDEQDRVIRNRPDTILTKAGANDLDVWEICNSTKEAASELNTANVWRGKFKNLLSWDYLTEDAFYMGRAKKECLEFHERLRPDIRMYRHENTGGYRASIRTRFGVHVSFGFWRNWCRGGGTSA